MSTSHIDIVVKNTSAEIQQFLIFHDKPVSTKNVGPVFTNVWGTSPGVMAKNGSSRFQIIEEFFAVCGMEPQELAHGLKVSTSGFLPVKIGSGAQKAEKAKMDIVYNGAVFDLNVTSYEKDGSFGIDTAGFDMVHYKTAFCGMGMINPVPNVEEIVPVAVFSAKPSQSYSLTPHRIYYIATGNYQPGTIIDVTTLGQIATVDFTGRSENRATVTLGNDLAFKPVDFGFEL